MGFNLEDYETVESRIDKFYTINGDGAIYTQLLSDPNNIDTVVVQAYIFISGEPVATGLASETRDKELSKTSDGREYASVNYTAWLENAETSAIGRALANYNLSGAKRPSREEMEKVERGEKGSTSPPMPTERADEPPQPSDGLFGVIATAATKGKFGEDAIKVMSKAAEYKKDGKEEALKRIIEEWEL